MNFEASGRLKYDEKIQYLCMLVHGEALCQFYTLYYEVGIATPKMCVY